MKTYLFNQPIEIYESTLWYVNYQREVHLATLIMSSYKFKDRDHDCPLDGNLRGQGELISTF
jgi:hypothetical protein